MKKKITGPVSNLLMAIGLLLCLSACGDKAPAAEQPARQTGDDSVTVEMTDHEKDLLCEIYPMEERIREGRLFDYQMTTLEAYREGMNYLEGKYPGYSFTALSLTPATKFDPWMTVRVQSVGTEVRELRVTPEGSGYTFSDTFYNEVLREQYDAELEKLLLSSGIEAKAFTEFPSPRTEIGPGTGTEELFSRPIPRMTHIYVPGDGEKEEVSGAVREAVAQNNIYGNYILYFPDSLDESIESLESGRLDMESDAFSYFGK